MPYIAVMAALVLAGLAARILWALFVPTEQLYDFATYHTLAVNIKNGLGHSLGGKPIAWQGPLYPYLLAGFFKLFATESELAGKALNIVMSSLTLVLSIPVYLKLTGTKARTAAAVAVTAFLPHIVGYVNVLGTETLFVFILFIILLLYLYCSHKIWAYPLIGAAVGLAALTKPYMLAFPAVLAVLFWIRHKNIKRTALFTLICAGCACLVIAPWTYRNFQAFGRFIPVSYNGGYVRFINNNGSNGKGLWMDPLEAELDEADRAYIVNALASAGDAGVKAAPELEEVFNRLSSKWIAQNPMEFVKLGLLRLNATFWSGADDLAQWAMNGVAYKSERDRNTLEAMLGMTSKFLAAAGLLFVCVRLKSFFQGLFPNGGICTGDAILILLLLFFSAVVFISEGQARYAFPAYPFMVCGLLSLVRPEKADICKAKNTLNGDKYENTETRL